MLAKGNCQGFPGGASGNESACNAGDTGVADLIPGLGRSPGGESHGQEPGGLHGRLQSIGLQRAGHD